MPELPELADSLRALVQRTPPIVVLTRWQLLLGDETVRFSDAALEAGTDVSGTKYTFIAMTDSALCYLVAEHDDELWAYDPDERPAWAVPRSIIAWRRPLHRIQSIGLSDDPRDWLPNRDRLAAENPRIVLTFDDDSTIQLPLTSGYRAGAVPPDPASVITRISSVWGAGS